MAPKSKTPKYEVSFAGTVTSAETAEAAAELTAEIVQKNGDLIPAPSNGPNGVYEISLRSDGTLLCPDYRVAATPKMQREGYWPCRLCGRKVTPTGGRISAAPMVQGHLSGPMAYKARGLEMPKRVHHQLIRVGCQVDLSAEPVDPKIEKLTDEVIRVDTKVEDLGDRVSLIEARTPIKLPPNFDKIWELVSGEDFRAMIEDWAARRQNHESVQREEQSQPTGIPSDRKILLVGYSKEPPAGCTISSLPQVSQPLIAAIKDTKSAGGASTKEKLLAARKPIVISVAKAPPPAEKKRHFVRDSRLINCVGKPVSDRAAKFKQSRADLGIPASVVAEIAGFTLAEYQALESGELAPRDTSEKAFWADMRASLERAYREWAKKELPELPKGEPVAKESQRRYSPKMF